MKTRRLIAVPLLAGALALGACGGPGGDGDGPGDDPTSAPITAMDINAMDRSELAEGGEFRQAVSSLADNWNPMHTNGNQADYSYIRDPMSPRLFVYNEKGEPEPDPNYLTEMPAIEGGEAADDPLIVTYKLNPDAVWNDGSPIDVEDMQAEWNACKEPGNGFECVSTEGYDKIESVEAGADEFEVVVTYESAYPDWTGTFGLMKAESIKDEKTFNEGWSDLNELNDWFSGPFKLDKLDETQQIVTLVPNDKWWGEKPLLEKMSFRVISADATASSYENNEIDSFDIGPDPDAYARAQGVADGAIRAAAGPNFRHFTFNQEAGMLKDKTVRQAIVMGLDRTEIGASDMAGIDWPVKPLNNHIFLETQEGYSDSAEATGIDFNPDGAKKLLEDDGWEMGDDGYYAKDGETLTVKFSQIVAVPVSENEALQAQAMLKEVGIKVEIVDLTQENWNDKLNERAFELIAFSWLGTPYPHPSLTQIYGKDQENNFSGTAIPEVADLTKQVMTEVDPEKRNELTNQADELLWEDVNTLPLYQRPDLWASKANLGNWGAFGLSSPYYENIGFTKE